MSKTRIILAIIVLNSLLAYYAYAVLSEPFDNVYHDEANQWQMEGFERDRCILFSNFKLEGVESTLVFARNQEKYSILMYVDTPIEKNAKVAGVELSPFSSSFSQGVYVARWDGPKLPSLLHLKIIVGDEILVSLTGGLESSVQISGSSNDGKSAVENWKRCGDTLT